LGVQKLGFEAEIFLTIPDKLSGILSNSMQLRVFGEPSAEAHFKRFYKGEREFLGWCAIQVSNR
jgi:hypothetical protein